MLTLKSPKAKVAATVDDTPCAHRIVVPHKATCTRATGAAFTGERGVGGVCECWKWNLHCALGVGMILGKEDSMLSE